MASIELRGLTKRWGAFVAVDEMSLTIADQEFVVFLGPSGCGKTTTMRMIAGLEEATAGDILIDGKRVNDLDPKDRDIAMVFQSYALYPNMNVFENIRFPLKVRKVPVTNTQTACAALPIWWNWGRSWGASHPNCRVAKDSVLPWRGRLCANRRFS